MVVRLLFDHLADSREQRFFSRLVYLLVAVAGVAALIKPPNSIESEFGLWLTLVWAGFLLLGGFAGFFAVNPGAWWLEKIACTAAGVGTAMYATVVLSMGFAAPGNRIPQACMILIVFLMLSFRAWQIRGFDHEPRG